jgi:uncharacterized surface protein with fasciclin (FAS1) repeats
MITRVRALGGVAATAIILTLGLAACAGESEPQAGGPAVTAPAPTTMAADPNAPFGPACAGLPASGPGSPADMAGQPVATAASQNPALSTLVSAVAKAGLVDTLNDAENLTVFAPTNDAFAKIPADTLKEVLADKKTLTSILTYHVVGQRTAPAELEDGRLVTLQGGTITTAKSGDTYTADDARVVCGNVRTSNATVYIVDTVLMPKS